MKRYFVIVLLLVWIEQLIPLYAANYLFKQLSIPEGIPASIQSIYAEKNGFVWIGTKKGLGRFDGYELKLYTHKTEDPYSLPGNEIYQIVEDSLHNIWILTNQGLVTYDKKTTHFIKALDEQGKNIIASAACKMKGRILFCTRNNIFQYSYADKTLKKIINQDVSVKMFSKVIKSMNALDTTTYIGMNTKNLAESLASFMTEKIPVSSKKVSKFLNNDSIKLNMKINLLVDNSSREINADELLGMLKNTAKEDYLQNTALVNRILKSKSVNPQIYRLAVWGAGRFRNDENFEIIKNIALDVTEKDIRKREFAIHSLALYLKDKPSEVRNILGSIENDNTDFSMLGKILNDKILCRE